MKKDIINKLKISTDKKIISWVIGRNIISKNYQKVYQALVDPKKNHVLVISNVDDSPLELDIFQNTGQLIQKINSPQGFYFSYITSHPDFGICLVCSTDRPIEGWYDWYFKIDYKRGILIKKGPSY